MGLYGAYSGFGGGQTAPPPPPETSWLTVKSGILGRWNPTMVSTTNYGTGVTSGNGFAMDGVNDDQILTWTVPAGMGGVIRFKVKGAAGGTHSGTWGAYYCQPGSGALVDVTYTLADGDVVAIVPGQRPTSTTSNGSLNGSGGGGGSFVYLYDPVTPSYTLIAAAGGGGGTGHGTQNQVTGGMGLGGSATTNSNEFGGSSSTNTGQVYNNYRTTNVWTAGSSGNNGMGLGGNATNNTTNYGRAGGGAGWNGDGDSYTADSGGDSKNDWRGGDGDSGWTNGGYGGGGGSHGTGNAAGGGGGYTGGGGGHGWQDALGTYNSWGCGAGGGSWPTSLSDSANFLAITAGVTAFGGVDTGTTDNGYIEILI